MKTTQIITSQIKYIIENASDFIKICLLYALITIVMGITFYKLVKYLG